MFNKNIHCTVMYFPIALISSCALASQLPVMFYPYFLSEVYCPCHPASLSLRQAAHTGKTFVSAVNLFVD